MINTTRVPQKIRRRELKGGLPETGNIMPLLRRVYLGRGVNSEEELENGLDGLAHLEDLPGMEKACDVLVDAFKNQQEIMIVGDFDADGSATIALLIKGLRKFGFDNCNFLVPNRSRNGYGLSKEVINYMLFHASPDLVITADCGATSVEGAAELKKCGISVIITDHHECDCEIPDVAALVNPALDEKANKLALAGVGVAFYLLIALRKRFIDECLFVDKPPRLDCYLDLVALGTVADVVPLTQNNRILVSQGLRRIRAGKACAGLNSLFTVSRSRRQSAVASDLSYCIAPRLNAASLIKDRTLGVRCLIADDRRESVEYAGILEGIGGRTRELEQQLKSGKNMAEICNLSPQEEGGALCICVPNLPEDFLSSIALLLKSRYRKPSAVFTKTLGGMLRGAACSVNGMHICRVLQRIAERNPNLLTHFGGHAVSATLLLKEDCLEEFKKVFNEEVNCLCEAGEFSDKLLSDGQLDVGELTFENAVLLREGGPWGKGFPEPVFDGVFDVWRQWMVGKRHLKMVLSPDGVDLPVYAILFNACERGCAENMEKVHIAYRLEADEFKGRRAPLLYINHIEVLA